MPELQRILYVEDEADQRMIGALSLEKVGGFTLLACASGEEAVERALAFAPDMILMDMILPGMNGVETMIKLREFPTLLGIPVLFLTASELEEVREGIKREGGLGVLQKPFDPMTLPTLIRQMWKEYHG